MGVAQVAVNEWRNNCKSQLCSLYMRFFIIENLRDTSAHEDNEILSLMYSFFVVNEMASKFCSGDDVIVVLRGIQAVLLFEPPGIDLFGLFPPIEYGHHSYDGMKSAMQIGRSNLS